MESEKIENFDGWSEENDQDTGATTKRSYDCTFCKRGFTNAQALGGHMNIHRKDRAKAKQPSTSLVPNDDHLTVNRGDHHMNPSHLRPIFPTQVPTKYDPVSESQMISCNNNNYHMYFQPQVSNSKLPYGYVRNEEVLGANLSLRTGVPTVHDDGDGTTRGIMKQDEVDLELRLGHNP